jgi:hypothetical protein
MLIFSTSCDTEFQPKDELIIKNHCHNLIDVNNYVSNPCIDIEQTERNMKAIAQLGKDIDSIHVHFPLENK